MTAVFYTTLQIFTALLEAIVLCLFNNLRVKGRNLNSTISEVIVFKCVVVRVDYADEFVRSDRAD